MMAAVSYQNAPVGSDDVEFEYDVNKKGEVVMVEAQKRQYYVTRERQSYSLAFDYDINPNHRLTLQGIYNRRHDWENRHRVTYKDLDKQQDWTMKGICSNPPRSRQKEEHPTTETPVWNYNRQWISV